MFLKVQILLVRITEIIVVLPPTKAATITETIIANTTKANAKDIEITTPVVIYG